MLIIPAIDLRAGRCVRLFKGDPDQETVFAEDPVAMARSWEEKGAPMLHVVDLDGAFQGMPGNPEVVQAIVRGVGIPVQLGGGIRTMETIEKWLDLGVHRVILGTVAIDNPQLVADACRLYGERVLVGIDSKHGLVAVRGWADTTAKTAPELALEMRGLGVKRVVYTDTGRDGTLTGPNLQATRELAETSGLRVIASGGMSSLEDVRAVAALVPAGVEGVILGKALYTGAIKLPEALAAASGKLEYGTCRETSREA